MSTPAPNLRAPEPVELRQQLTWVTIAWVFGSAWLWAVSGAAMFAYARELKMPDYALGALAALPFLGTFFQIPASYYLERYGGRRAFFLWTASISRLLWTVAALIPWLLPGVQWAWWPTLIGLLLISWIAAQASGVAWMNWMSDLIPRRVRGRYFAVRRVVTQPIGIIVTIGIGLALDYVEAVQTERADLMLAVASGILAIGGLFGVLDILCFRKVQDEHPPPPRHDVELLSLITLPLRDRMFRRYLGFNFTFTLAVGFMGQYVWPYAQDELKWSKFWQNTLIIAVPLLLQMVTFRMWGRLIDRLGKKPIMVLTGMLTVFGSAGWILITQDNFWLGYLLILGVTLAWPGLELANSNILFDMAGSRRLPGHPHGRERAAAGTAYVAVNSLAVSLGGVLSGFVIGAGVAKWLGENDFRWTVPVVGITLTYHGVLFLISTGLRGAAMVWVLGIEEPQAVGTRDALRFLSGSIYSNVRQAAIAPIQFANWAIRGSYRIDR